LLVDQTKLFMPMEVLGGYLMVLVAAVVVFMEQQ
jgi:hypothetical protein